ncbi:MAG TPA: hypothetical protein VE643_09015 [Nitrososphaeraceae archaeon]|nr:hypothetical protein [Nitrososphaeraceae archaeon]
MHCSFAINLDKFDKLITSLRTALDDDDGTLDKESTSYNDIFDAFRLALKFITFKRELIKVNHVLPLIHQGG